MEGTPIFEQLYQESLDTGAADALADLDQTPAEQVPLADEQAPEDDGVAGLDSDDAQPASPATEWVVPEERVA